MSDPEDPEIAATVPDRGVVATRPSTPGATRASVATIRKPEPSGRRYELGAEIARGGMGRVVEAMDTVLGRTVAIKEVLTVNDDLIQRFDRETQITARLEHPSIIPVHDAGRQPNGAPFYVMRKVTGKPLDELVRATTSLNERLALVPHVLAAANALAHAHGRGVIHRDMKPTNILVGKLGETVVIDWGLAKVIDDAEDPSDEMTPLKDSDGMHTRVGSVVGTPGFMSPEQLRGQAVNAQADVYALGATLYYLLARQSPHAAKTGDEMMMAALAGPPTPLRELAPGVPAELGTIVDRALAPATDVRYRDAAGFAEDLDRFLKGQLVASHRYSRRERFARWLRRNRISVAIATVAALMLIVGGWIAIARTLRERDRADDALVLSQEQNEQLQLARALTLVPTHPTGAVALARDLATKHWPTARALAMAARARGVAYGLPASQFTRSLEMANDGIRVLSAGSDGVIRIHDLRARTSHVVANLGTDAFAIWAEQEASIVAWTQNKLVVIPVAGGTMRELTLASEPRRVRGQTDQLAWCDKDGAVWSMSLTKLEPTRIEIPDRVDHLAAYGNVFALAGEKKLWLLTGTGPTAVVDGHARELAWSPSGQLAAVLDDFKTLNILESNMRGEVISTTEYPDAYAVGWQNGILWVGSRRGLGTRVAVDIQVRGGVHQLLPGPGESLIARTRTSAFTLFDGKVTTEIPPTYAIHDLATGPTSNFVAAGSDYIVLVWNLDAFRPQEVPLAAPVRMMYTAADQMIAIHDDAHASWIDLVPLRIVPIDLPAAVDAIVFAPDGSSALALTKGHSAVLFRRGVPGSRMIASTVTAATFTAPTQIVIGDEAGKVRIIDLTGAPVRDLVAGSTKTLSVELAGDWLVASFSDGQLARVRIDGTAPSLLPADGKVHWIELFATGDLAYTDFSVLRVWHPDGTSTPYPGLPTPVSAVEAIGPDAFIVYTGGDSAHLVELGKARAPAAVYPPGTRMEWLRLEGDHGVYLTPDGALFETSPRTGVSWRVANPRREPLVGPLLSRDRTRIYALAGSSLLVWTQTLPPDATATAALFDTLTNAHPVADPAGAIPMSAPTLRLGW